MKNKPVMPKTNVQTIHVKRNNPTLFFRFGLLKVPSTIQADKVKMNASIPGTTTFIILCFSLSFSY